MNWEATGKIHAKSLSTYRELVILILKHMQTMKTMI